LCESIGWDVSRIGVDQVGTIRILIISSTAIIDEIEFTEIDSLEDAFEVIEKIIAI
jgi:hypothetical protein